MADEPTDLTLEILRAMRGELADFRRYISGEIGDVKLRLSTIEQHLGTIDARLARVDDRLDHIEARTGRIEAQLNLVGST